MTHFKTGRSLHFGRNEAANNADQMNILGIHEPELNDQRIQQLNCEPEALPPQLVRTVNLQQPSKQPSPVVLYVLELARSESAVHERVEAWDLLWRFCVVKFEVTAQFFQGDAVFVVLRGLEVGGDEPE